MGTKNILICGASGYGNVGDEAYKYIFDRYLSSEYNLFFDSPYPDTSYMDKIDYLVIGGGGLIHEFTPNHFVYMNEYVEEAKKRGIKYSIISCGIQYIEQIDKQDYLNLTRWIPILDGADIITLRSQTDVEVIEVLSENKNIHYFPDLAYLTYPANYRIAGDIDVAIIPTDEVAFDYKFNSYISDAKKDGKTIYLLAFSRDDYRLIDYLRQRHNLSDHENYRDRKLLTPREACRTLQDSKKVITARYHGLVLSIAAGKRPEDIINMESSYKLKAEVIPSNILDAGKHMGKLEEVLENA